MNAMPEGAMAPQPSWWSRNWKWVVPVGCLGLLASCGCLGAIVIGLGVSSAKDAALPYAEAVSIAKEDPEVQRELGTPIQNSLPRQTSIQTVNGNTHARFTIPLDGPTADGLLQVDAEKDGGEWTYRVLSVELENGRRIDLRGDSDEAPLPDTGEEGDDTLAPPLEPDDTAPGPDEDAARKGDDITL